MSHLREAITTWGKMWSAEAVRPKTTTTRFKVILNMTRTLPGTTTMWSHSLRPRTFRHYTSRPSTVPLNRRYMYTKGWAVHVPVVQLILTPLISLPPKAELNKVTIPMAVVIVKPHLSLGWWLVHSLVGMVHSWWLLDSRKGILRDVWQSVKWVPEMVRFWNPHLFLGWSFWRFFKHSIFNSGLSGLR